MKGDYEIVYTKTCLILSNSVVLNTILENIRKLKINDTNNLTQKISKKEQQTEDNHFATPNEVIDSGEVFSGCQTIW